MGMASPPSLLAARPPPCCPLLMGLRSLILAEACQRRVSRMSGDTGTHRTTYPTCASQCLPPFGHIFPPMVQFVHAAAPLALHAASIPSSILVNTLKL